MGRSNNNSKATRGRSTVVRATREMKSNIAEKNKVSNTPFKILNNLFPWRKK